MTGCQSIRLRPFVRHSSSARYRPASRVVPSDERAALLRADDGDVHDGLRYLGDRAFGGVRAGRTAYAKGRDAGQPEELAKARQLGASL